MHMLSLPKITVFCTDVRVKVKNLRVYRIIQKSKQRELPQENPPGNFLSVVIML